MDSSPAEPPGKSKDTGVGSLSLLQWISQPRNRTGVSCIAGGFFTNCTIRGALQKPNLLLNNHREQEQQKTMLEPTRKRPYIQRQRRSQMRQSEGHNRDKSNPVHVRRAMHRLENNYTTEVLPVWSPTSGFPDRGLEMEEEPPEDLALKTSRV